MRARMDASTRNGSKHERANAPRARCTLPLPRPGVYIGLALERGDVAAIKAGGFDGLYTCARPRPAALPAC